MKMIFKFLFLIVFVFFSQASANTGSSEKEVMDFLASIEGNLNQKKEAETFLKTIEKRTKKTDITKIDELIFKGKSCSKECAGTPVSSDEKQQSHLLVFVSFSLGKEVLKNLYKQAKPFGGRLVLRGLIDNKIITTQEAIKDLEIEVDIDPSLFEKHNIRVVPSIVQIQDKEINKLEGYISMENALEIFRGSPKRGGEK